MKKEFFKKSFIVAFLFILALFICMQSSFAPSGSYIANCDAAIYKQVGFSIANGQTPYTDIYDNKGPVFYYLIALGEIIHGTYGLFIVELILMFISTYFAYKTATLFTNKTISLLSTFLLFIGINEMFWSGTMTEEYVLPFTFISLFLFVKYFKTKQVIPLHIFTIGLCSAISIMIRANLIAVYIGFILIIFIDMICHKKFKSLFISIGSFIGGFIIVILPIAIHLHLNNALYDCITQVYLGPSSYFTNITFLEKLNLLHLLLSNFNNFGYLFLIFYIIYVIYLCVKRINTPNKLIHICSLLSILVNMYLCTLSNANFSHYSMSFIPLLLLPIITVLELIYNNITVNKNAVILILVLVLGWESINTCITNVFHNTIGKYDNSFYQSINELTNENDKIYIFDGYQYMYLTNRLSASKYIYIPINFDTENSEKVKVLDGLLQDLTLNRPKIILISDESYNKYSTLPYYDFKKFDELLNNSYTHQGYILSYNLYILK